EDALRQRVAVARLRAPGPAHRFAAGPPDRHRDREFPADRPAHRRGRVRRRAGRGHRRRGGPDLRLDDRAAGRRAGSGRRRVGGRLRRTSRHGTAGTSGAVLEDYACLADGLLAVHQATGEARWLDVACELLDTALARFVDPERPGAYYDTADDAERLVRRPSD